VIPEEKAAVRVLNDDTTSSDEEDFHDYGSSDDDYTRKKATRSSSDISDEDPSENATLKMFYRSKANQMG
jgi:hypothetical protein